MKKLLFLLLLPICLQAQRVYPTKILGLNMLVYVPAGADTTKAMNGYLFTPGAGEQGTNISLLYNHGPFQYAKNGGVDMGTSALIFAVQNVNANPRPSEIDSYITAIGQLYKINKLILTGLSRGGQNSEWYANDTIRQSNIKKLAALIVFSSQGTVTGYADAPAPFNAAWFVLNNIPILRGEGDQDFTWPQNYAAHLALSALFPRYDKWVVWPGAGHGDPVWADGYNPAVPKTSPLYAALGGRSIYQWGDSVMGNYVAPAGPIAKITIDTVQVTTPISVIRLSGAASTGTGLSYAWSELSGPNTAGSSLIPGNATDMIFWGLIPGSYVFQLTVKDSQGQASIVTVTVNIFQPAPRTATAVSVNVNGTTYPVPLSWLKITYSDGNP